MLLRVPFLLLVSAASSQKTIEIAPGVNMPFVNLGGVLSSPSNYSEWLRLGGTGLDTALTYGDIVQRQVAAALAQTTVKRSDIFVTTKVPCCPLTGSGHCQDPEFNGSIASDIKKDIDILGHVDLLLLHWPCDTYAQTLQAYTDVEQALKSGVTRAIGVSNFNASLLERLAKDAKVKPAVNQCGHSVGAHNASHNPQIGGDDATAKYCADHAISYSAYSPLGGLNKVDIWTNLTVQKIAKEHGVSPAQVALRWLVQQSITVVTAADKASYESEDMDVFSFSLTDDEMATLASL
jgi:diketogulonate reductase-like aldo/keto reductase